MDDDSVLVVSAAVLTAIVAMAAVALDRFRNVPAAGLPLAGGLVPWIVIAGGLYVGPLWIVSVFGSGPVFCMAACVYLAKQKPPRIFQPRERALPAC